MPEPPVLGTVSPEAFRRIREIFEEALVRPAAERRTFVEAACKGDTVVAAEVVRMLAGAEGEHGLLDGQPRRPRLEPERPVHAACPSCQAALEPAHRFCPACGSPVAPGVEEGRFRA